MFQKAVYFGNQDSADQILKSKDPVEAKEIGKKATSTRKSGSRLQKTVCTGLLLQNSARMLNLQTT